MTYAFLKYVYGTDDLDPIMNSIEYAPHTNPGWDPFSVIHNVSALLYGFHDGMLIFNRFLGRIRTRL